MVLLMYRSTSLTEAYGYYDPATGRTMLPSDGTKLSFEDVIVFVVGGGNYSEYQHLQVYARNQNPARVILYGSTDILPPNHVRMDRSRVICSSCLNFRLLSQNSVFSELIWLLDCLFYFHFVTFWLPLVELSFMFARLMVYSSRMASIASFPSMRAIRTNTSIGIQQRNFGIFSSIRENVNDKLEEKKKKTQGLI